MIRVSFYRGGQFVMDRTLPAVPAIGEEIMLGGAPHVVRQRLWILGPSDAAAADKVNVDVDWVVPGLLPGF